MWVDKVLYWSWIGNDRPTNPPPTNKRIKYVKIIYDTWKPKPITINIASSVFDNDKETLLNCSEIEWHRSQGAKIEE